MKEWHGHSDQILDIAVSRSVSLQGVGELLKYSVVVCVSFRSDSAILSASNDGTVRVFLDNQS